MYILHNISIFHGIVQTDIMIHKFIIVKYFLADKWNYMSYREQVRSYILSQDHCTRTSCDHSSQAFIVYAYSHEKYLQSLLSCITCLHDDVPSMHVNIFFPIKGNILQCCMQILMWVCVNINKL